jgi:hypothetical protein
MHLRIHPSPPAPLALVALITVATLVSGCAPMVTRYRHLSLSDVDHMVVTRTGRPALQGHARLFIRPMPLAYRLEREHYTLLFEVDPERPTSLYVGVTSAHGVHALRFAAVPGGGCIRVWPPDAALRPDRWLYSWMSCPPRAPAPDRLMRFSVLDAHGDVAGEEVIPFTLDGNGFYMYLDAI